VARAVHTTNVAERRGETAQIFLPERHQNMPQPTFSGLPSLGQATSFVVAVGRAPACPSRRQASA